MMVSLGQQYNFVLGIWEMKKGQLWTHSTTLIMNPFLLQVNICMVIFWEQRGLFFFFFFYYKTKTTVSPSPWPIVLWA